MKRLHVTMVYQMVGDTHIDVPDDMDIDTAIQYAKDHIDEIPTPCNGSYISGADEIDEDNCDFEDNYEDDFE